MQRSSILIKVFLISSLIITACFMGGSACKPATLPTAEPTTPTPAISPEPTVTPDDDQIEPPDSEHDAVAIIIDHQHTDISQIPLQWINQVKSNLRVLYFHASHGNQITLGMKNLQAQYDATYDFTESGSGEALSYHEMSDDLGHLGDLNWVDETQNKLSQTDNDRNVVIWSWCGGASDNTEEGIDIYLKAMNQLELDYPDITFIYMTGHLDGTGESGNLNIRNNQVRDYAIANNKILFDFADIESYDPDGNYFLDLNANADGSYDGGNWAEEWAKGHPDSDLSWGSSGEHTHFVNINLKGRAFWWLLARISGWDG